MNTAQLQAQFSSETSEWSTPDWLFRELDEEFNFDVDVCALPENAKCERFFSPAEDGLRQQWQGRCWCNPPYGNQIGLWVHKAWESAQAGALVVCLLPSRTDSAWWFDYVMEASEIRFLRGRLKFGAGENSAPFPSAVAVFRPPLTSMSER